MMGHRSTEACSWVGRRATSLTHKKKKKKKKEAFNSLRAYKNRRRKGPEKPQKHVMMKYEYMYF